MQPEVCQLEGPAIVNDTVRGLESAVRLDGRLGNVVHAAADILWVWSIEEAWSTYKYLTLHMMYVVGPSTAST